MIGITGSTAHLGRLLVETRFARGVRAGEIVALARTLEKARDLAARGVRVRRADSDEPKSLAATLRGRM